MMIKVKPKYHRLFIPALTFIIFALVVGLLILAAFAQDTAFWVVIVILDLIIIYLGYANIRSYKKPRIMSTPLGKVLEYEGRGEIERQEEGIEQLDLEEDKEEDKSE